MKSFDHAFSQLDIVWSESAFAPRDVESKDRWYRRCRSIAGSETAGILFESRTASRGLLQKEGRERTLQFRLVGGWKAAAS